MKSFNKFLREESAGETLAKLLYPNGPYNSTADLMFANLHLATIHDYPIEQVQPGLPFRDDNIKHRHGHIDGGPAPAPNLSVEQIEEFGKAELSEAEKAARDTIIADLQEDLPPTFAEDYGKNIARAIYAHATREVLEEGIGHPGSVKTYEELMRKHADYTERGLHELAKAVKKQAAAAYKEKRFEKKPVNEDVKDLSYFTEYKKTGESDVEVTPHDESSALTLAKKYEDLAKSSDDPKITESAKLAAQRFYDTANRLRSFKKRRTGEPKQRLKESEFDDLVAMLEHVISSSEDHVVELDEGETFVITPEMAGKLYNSINELDEEAQVAFIDQITESVESLQNAFKETTDETD